MESADNLGDENHYIPGTLESWVREWGVLNQDAIFRVFDGLLDGLEHLHGAGLIHRDIKPDNIVLVEGIPKLGDIGLVGSASRSLSMAGTQAYVPPEILTGESSRLSPAIDYYALGKTLYRAFFGQQPDDFPGVSCDRLAAPGGKQLNILVKRACHPEPFCRICTGEEFRAALHGRTGLRYEIKYFLAVSWSIMNAPFRHLWLGIRFIWRNPWGRTAAILLLIVWGVLSCFTYQRMEFLARGGHYNVGRFPPLLFIKAMWLTLYSSIPGIPQYDLYDFLAKDDELVRKYGSRFPVTRKMYLKSKYPGVWDVDTDVTFGAGASGQQVRSQPADNPRLRFSPFYLDTIRRHVKWKEGLGKENWRLSGPGYLWWELENGEEVLVLQHGRDHLELSGELPLFYEINSSFLLKDFNGSIEFLIRAADYLEPERQLQQNESRLRQLIRIPVKVEDGKLLFGKMYFREQNGDDERPGILGNPLLPSFTPQDGEALFQIVTVLNCIRVYVNGHLIYFTQVPFFSGLFSVNYTSREDPKLKMNRFSVYDISHADGRKIPLEKRYQLPSAGSREDNILKSYERLGDLAGLLRVIDTPEWLGGSSRKESGFDITGQGIWFLEKFNLIRYATLKDDETVELSVVMESPKNHLTIRLQEVNQNENGELVPTGKYWNIKANGTRFEDEVKGLAHDDKPDCEPYRQDRPIRIQIHKNNGMIFAYATSNATTLFDDHLNTPSRGKWTFALDAYAEKGMKIKLSWKRSRM